MMKCKFHCLNFSPYKLFKKMENNNGSIADKCSCEELDDVKNDNNAEASASTSRDKQRNSNFALWGGLCKDKTNKRGKKSLAQPVKRTPKWGIKFNCMRRESKSSVFHHQGNTNNCCRCTCYHHNMTNEHMVGLPAQNVVEQAEAAGVDEVYNNSNVSDSCESYFGRRGDRGDPIIEENPQGARGIYSVSPATSSVPPLIITAPWSNMHRIRNHEDCDEAARMARAREIEQGVEAPANFRSIRRVQLLCSDIEPDPAQSQPVSSQATGGGGAATAVGAATGAVAATAPPPRWLQLVCPPDLSVESLRALFQNHVTLKSCPPDAGNACHTQVDFIHCLVPDLLTITNCSFYWGKMDRYEAERLLEGKPEGTFLLRDSAQEEFLFSVSFRKYGRSLHARIEQWNHKFSFDSHDPGVYTSNTVCGLIEHYKDPSSCMFFEPVLTLPLHRRATFSLQHMARAAIVSRLTYDSINQLQLPKTLKTYLKEYHYRQKVRVEIFDDDMQWLELRNTPT